MPLEANHMARCLRGGGATKGHMSADQRSETAIGHGRGHANQERVCAKAETYANNCIHKDVDMGERRVLPATDLWHSLGS